MAAYTIKPIEVGEFETLEHSVQVHLTSIGEKRRVPIVIWLIEGEGKKILVDTGCSDPAFSAKYHHKMYRPEEMKLENALQAKGLAPADVDCIVMTHLHWDHCYNMELFPGKTFYVQRKEVEYAIAPYPPHYVCYDAAENGVQAAWLPYRGQFKYLDGDCDLYPGIKLVFLPGHTPGFQGVLVDTANGKWLIAGDLCHSYHNWEGEGIRKHIPAGIYTSMRDYYTSFDKVERLCPADHVLPGHDMKILEHEVYPF